MLIGRAAETAAVERLLDAACTGRSSVLVVHGEAGVGKSALLDHAVERAGANGNPLALVELPASLTREQLSGRGPLDRTLLPTTSVEEAYLERVKRLSSSARSLLLLAAAEDSGDRGTVMRAGAELGLDAGELTDAEAEGLVKVGSERIEFRHPLVRSAVYRGAGFAERDRAHRTLAGVLPGEQDADRRAWHLAAATAGSDDEVAAILEQTADRARLRAGDTAVSAALERAADLSADLRERNRRLALAAVAADRAGRATRSIALAERVQSVDDPILRADLADARGSAELLVGRPDAACDIFAAAAEAAAPHDPLRALDLASGALEGASRAGDADRIARAIALGVAVDPDPHDSVQVLFSMLFRGVGALFSGDTAAGVRLMQEALAATDDVSDPRQLMWCAVAARFIGDAARARALYVRAVAESRRTGALRVLVAALAAQAAESFVSRLIPDAAAQADEAVRLARELGTEIPAAHPRAVLAWIDALHGREDECRRRAEGVLRLSATYGLAFPAGAATWALAELDLGRGRWEEALAKLEQLAEVRPGFGHRMTTILTSPDRIEAAVRAGRPDAAQTSLAVFEAWAESTGEKGPAAQLERCRGLLAPTPDEAARHYDAALRLHADGGSALDRARTELLYGELLRRERQRVEARRHLRSALTTFEQLGATLWGERAAAELRATGETARRRDPSTIAQLTPQELQIARLVGEGSSNKEVAAQLFLSPRTVEYHLRKVFQKLAISSRAELMRHFVQGAEREELTATAS